MNLRYRVSWIVLLLFASLLSCVPSETRETPPANPVDLNTATPEVKAEYYLNEWKALAKNAEQYFSSPKPSDLASNLAKLGTSYLIPILDVLADPSSSPQQKILVVQSVTPVMHPDLFPTLKPLTGKEYDNTTRACAITLLSSVPTPDLAPLFRDLTKDDDQRVQFSAWLGLAALSDAPARAELRTWYERADVSVDERAQIALLISTMPMKQDLPFLEKVIQDYALDSIDSTLRIKALYSLSVFGDEAALSVLERCIQEDPDEKVRGVAKNALAALKTKLEYEKKGP